MSLPARIKDGLGRGYHCAVTQDHALRVSVVQSSAADVGVDLLTAQKLYRGYLLSGASSDMTVDGSATPVEFSLGSVSSMTRWITSARVLLNDTGMELDTNDFRDFGSGHSSGLTNGCEFVVEQGGVTTKLFTDPIKTIGGFMDFADEYTNFVNAITSQSDFLSFDFHFDVPIVLPPATQDRLVFTINDDLTTVDLMTVIVRGYQEVAT